MRTAIFLALIAFAVAVPVEKATQPAPENDIACILCTEIVAAAEKELASNATETQIKHAIEQVCTLASHIPGGSAACQFVEDNIDEIIQLLVSQLNPTEVCKLIGQCPNANPVVKKPVSIDTCTTCQELVQVIEYELQQNATITEIQALVGKACQVLEKYVPSIAAECQFVQDNIPTIIGLIVSKVSPLEVCTLIGQCTAHTTFKPVQLAKPVEGEYCETCEELVQLIETELNNTATKEEIKQLIQEACVFIEKYVPEIAAECQMIEENIDQIIDLIISQVTPVEVCTLLGLCDGNAIPAIVRALRTRHMV